MKKTKFIIDAIDARGQVPDIREDYKTFTESFC